MGYVVTALLSRYWLHEQLSISRWLGILFIVGGVGFVAGGPSRTEDQSQPAGHLSADALDFMDSGIGR